MTNELTSSQKMLLAIGLSRGEPLANGKYKNTLLKVEDAYALYGSKPIARENLTSLMFWGYIETTSFPGRFRILAAPEECIKRADVMRKNRKASLK